MMMVGKRRADVGSSRRLAGRAKASGRARRRSCDDAPVGR